MADISRFVVLHHFGWPGHVDHYDLMLEWTGQLRTWSLADWPAESMQATALPAHRLHYLEYEGPISNGRGQVRRVDAGSFELVAGALGEDATMVECRLFGLERSAWCRLSRSPELEKDQWLWQFRLLTDQGD